jgi:exonuclease SbcC
MRPVRLDINGFASFREPAVVDFTDADYFALIGPTGSGKSTVIDALTFALYGTAPRWGRTNAIADALAPTTIRCTVSLTFDVGAQRYQIAREIRRVGNTIQQKNVSLVRFTDPNATVIDDDGPQPEVLAGDIRDVNRSIEQLLGLSFDDFCQCVVLPQGEFARFLSATPSVRQVILLKLLGADHYEGIGKLAGSQAANANREVEILTEQLARHAGATAEAESEAAVTMTTLGQLEVLVRDIVPRVVDAHIQAAEAAGRAQTLQAEQTLLGSLAVPGDVDELQRDATVAEAVADRARKVSAAAGQSFRDAATAATAGPQRAEVRQVRERYEEHATLTGRRDGVAADADRTARAAVRCQVQLTDAVDAVAAARIRTDDARRCYAGAQQEHAALLHRQQRLGDVREPAAVGDLAIRAGEISQRVTQAGDALKAARELQADAAAALASAPARDRIDQARTELAKLAEVAGLLVPASDGLDAATASANLSENALSAAQTRLDEAIAALDQANGLAGAAHLRPHLKVGHTCPVCDQPVTTLPPPLADPALDAARAARTAADREHRAALTSHRDANAQLTQSQRTADTLTERRTHVEERLATLLPGRGVGAQRDVDADNAHVNDLAGTRDQLETAAARARTALDAAEKAQASVTGDAANLEQDLAKGRGHVHLLCGKLADLNPPAVDVADLAAAWTRLETWARNESATLPEQVTAASGAVTAAETAHEQAGAELTGAEIANATAQTDHTGAVRAATTAEQQHANLTSRLRELDTLLAGAPPADQLDEQLLDCGRLEAAVKAASEDATTAQTAVEAAAREHVRWRSRVAAARAELNTARDGLAFLNPPALDPDDLAAGWAVLATWAQHGSTDRQGRITQALAEADAAAGQEQQFVAELEGQLRERDIDPADLGTGPGRAEQAPRVVAVAAERARGNLDAIRSSLAEASLLREKIGSARIQQQVATELAGLMRSDKFPRWLAEAGLDTLVAAASQSLLHLSGDQFDLTHKKGEFYVIDHTDADSERSVRTLSGGETFQASLSLALALSEQLAGMGGGTKLESIFLDEGFGTLDPDSLETVAETLENLAQGERMVGVITHVAGLAERAPVRYQVRRDHRTSSVIREGT